MDSKDQNLAQPPTSTTGSNWQRQAIVAARTAGQGARQQAIDAQQATGRPGATTDQNVPDMLAVTDHEQPSVSAQNPAPQSVPAQTKVEEPTGEANGEPVVSGPFGEDVSTVPITGTGGMSSGRKVMVVFVILLLLAAAGAGAYYFLFAAKKDKPSGNSQQQPQQSAGGTTVDISKVQALRFVEPRFTDLQKNDAASNATYTTYKMKDKECSLGFGVVSQSGLPGANVKEIVARQINILKGQAFVVSGPSAGEALVLKDAGDPSKQYKLETSAYSFTKGPLHGETFYSVAVLASGERLVADRSCSSVISSEVVTGDLTTLNNKAKELKLTTL